MRIVIFLILLWPSFVLGQAAATLVADKVTVTADKQLIATGNVEALYEDTRLTASEVTFDQPSDTLTITGPIVIRAPDGTVLTAERGSLDPQLENGILLGARLVLDQQMQIAANQIDRRDGRYSQLYKSAATSCFVCAGRAPLWEIRAQKVVHDEREGQLYFDNATFHIRGVPLFWLPRMRLPDPALDRATGLLIPIQQNTTQLGTGIKLPYFITLGDHRDLTVTPYVSAETRTLELRYRQAFANGNFEARGAASNDTLRDGTRSYLFANGSFRLPDEFQLSFDIEAVSDPAYLAAYGYSGKDRLDSAIGLLQVKDRRLTQANFIYYQTLRTDEDNSSLPPIVADLSYETRMAPDFGGVLTFRGSVDTAFRYSDVDGDKGRDVIRAGVQTNWRRDWLLDGGFLATTQTGVRADLFKVADDQNYQSGDLRVVPHVAASLRWPLATTTANGTSHLIEPAIQLSWAERIGSVPPNEDSTRNEFDRANLFDISRYAGDDAVETGAQLAFGLGWTRIGVSGTASTLTFGRILRNESNDVFTKSSGLTGKTSDWLISSQISLPEGLLFDTRALFDDEAELNRAASRLSWRNDDLSLSAAYIWQAKDFEEDRPGTTSEWTVSARFKLDEAVSVNLSGRYDVAADRPVRSGISLKWQNECVSFDVSASRRYSSSANVAPTTTFGFSGAVNGFSAGRAGGGPAASCSR